MTQKAHCEGEEQRFESKVYDMDTEISINKKVLSVLESNFKDVSDYIK